MRSIAFLLACALCAGAAHAQNITSSKHVGGWIIQCTVDGITDKTSCALVSPGTQVDGAHTIFLFWHDTATSPSLRFISDAIPLKDAVVRVDRNEPLSLPVCDSRDRICMVRLNDEAPLAQQVAKGGKILLRARLADGSRDYLFDLSGFDDAISEYRKLHVASGEPLKTHPIDALERAESNRIAAAEKLARQRAEEARASAAIREVIDGSRARCSKTFKNTPDTLNKCVSMVKYCSENPIPQNAKQFRECFSIWFPEVRFQTAGQ